jgi:hypothetical protein
MIGSSSRGGDYTITFDLERRENRREGCRMGSPLTTGFVSLEMKAESTEQEV